MFSGVVKMATLASIAAISERATLSLASSSSLLTARGADLGSSEGVPPALRPGLTVSAIAHLLPGRTSLGAFGNVQQQQTDDHSWVKNRLRAAEAAADQVPRCQDAGN